MIRGNVRNSLRCVVLSAVSLLLVLLSGNQCLARGIIVIIPPPGQAPPISRMHFSFAPMEVTYQHVDVQLHDQIATTTVDQEFFNPNNARLEGDYIFPLPAGAHIDKFSMDIDGVMQQAELLDSGKARSIYEEIVRKTRDPALLEYAGRDAFRVHIFPIEPRSSKKIKVSFTELLKSDNGLIEYTYELNTDKFSARPLRDVSVRMEIDSKDPIKGVYSPSHPISLRRDGENRATIGWEARDIRPDTDFKVLISRTQKPLGVDLLTYRTGMDDGYFLLLASPGMVTPRGGIQKKDICFVIDTSGSMSENQGKKIEQAKKALSFCLQNLNKDDRFNVIRFSTESEPLFDDLVDADAKHVSSAQEFVGNLKPIGGTAINDVLQKALAMRPDASRGGSDRPYVIIFITDGQPTVGDTSEDRIVANVSRSDRASTRIFCFGLGTDVNTHLLDRLAEQTNAVSQYVLPDEDLELKLGQFYTKIKEPVLANVHVAFEGRNVRVSQLYPNQIPDLFKGENLVLFGRYTGEGPGSVKVSGTLNGERNEFVTDVNFDAGGSNNSFVPQLWATRRVGFLLDEIRMHGENPELKSEVTRLARQHGIVTPYTAYLILEDEQRRNVPMDRQSFSELGRDKTASDAVKFRYESAKSEATDSRQRSGDTAVANAQALARLKDGQNQQEGQQQQELTKGMPQQGAGEGRTLMRSARGGYVGAGGAGGAGGGRRGASAADAAAPAALSTDPGYKQAQNYAQQARVVNSRAFYQNGDVWSDSTAQDALAKDKNLKQREIKFGSPEYFDLLNKHPEAAQWFSLGDKVDVMIDGELVKVR